MLRRTYYIDSSDTYWNTHKYDDIKITQTLHDLGADDIKSVYKFDDYLSGKVITFRTRRKNLRIYQSEFNRAFGSPYSFSVKRKDW